MNNKVAVLDLIQELDSLDLISISSIESGLGCKLVPVENKSMLGDLLGFDQNSVSGNTQRYSSESSTIFTEIHSIEVTVTKTSTESKVEFVEVTFKQGGMPSIDQIKNKWGSEYKLGLNRPSYPLGNRCYAEFVTKKSRLFFGFYNCQKMDEIIKVRILRA